MPDQNVRRSQDGPRPAQHQHQRYLHPKDGRLVPVVVQSFEDPRHLPQTSQWTRMGRPASRVPSLFKVGLWIGSSTIREGSNERIYTPASLAIAAAKMVVALPVTYCLVSSLDWGIPVFDRKTTLNLEMDTRYDGVFNRDLAVGQTTRLQPDPVAREEDDGAQRTPYLSNIRLNSNVTPRRTGTDQGAPWVSRTESTALSLRPRYLCFVKDFEEGTYETVQVSDYISEHGEQVDTEFIFVSYTRLQFRIATDEEIDAYDYPDDATREANREIAREDRATLIRWAIDAAAAAGKQAFWLDFECVRGTDGKARSTSNSEDVYRICDIVRASHSMIIGIGRPANERVAALLNGEDLPGDASESQTTWLRQWGSRLWTLPELLLCPSEYRIKLFVAGSSDEPRELAKRNFAERAWDDAESVKDLVNHYEGSAILSPLQLIATALECFSRRKTDQFSPGDIAYAIMGLLPDRQRPEVNQTDSGFQAFARLSLAHDDGRFLERLICLLPPRRHAKWFETDDLWGARLRDILPNCQVVKTGDADSIVLDGAFGATINWDGIDGSASLNLIHEVALAIVMAGIGFCVFLPKMWLLMLMFVSRMRGGKGLSSGQSDNTFILMSMVFTFFIPLLFAFVGPLILLWRSRGVKRATKAKLIGIEGFADAAQVEKYLWGYNFGRLTQMSNIPLYHDQDGQLLQEQSEEDGYAFTLVDTHSLTITHFRATRPPVAMFVCGQEGGMQRALLCSYDAATNTFCRETVVKVHNIVIEQMRRADRFRLTLEYPESADEDIDVQDVVADVIAAKSEGIDGATAKILDDGKQPWRLEWSFLIICLLAYDIYRNFDHPEFVTRHGPGPLICYGLGFIIAQVPTHYVLFRVSMTRIAPGLAFLKGTLVCFNDLALFYLDSSASQVAYFFREGFTDSAFLAVFVVFTWSWFTVDKVPSRMLIWACGFGVITGILEALVRYSPSNMPMLYAVLCFYLAVKGSGVITAPGEAAWLDAHKRVLYERRAAAFKWDTQRGAPGTSRWKSMPSSPQPWLFLVASFLHATTTLPLLSGWELSLFQAAASVVMLLFAYALLYRVPHLLSPIIVVGLLVVLVVSIIVQTTRIDAGNTMYWQLQNFFTPLLWALIVPTTSTAAESRWSLTLSLVGYGAGRLLTILDINIVWSAIAIALEALIVGCIWLCQRRREVKAARLLQARSVREEYHDDI